MPPPPLEGAASALLGELLDPREALKDLAYVALPSRSFGATAAATDGGNCVVADLGTCGIVGVRSGFVVRRPGDRYDDVLVRDAVRTVAKRRALDEWRRLVADDDWFQAVPVPNTQSPQWARGWAEAERTLAEFEAARRALEKLRPGDVLLWDGSLQADASFEAALAHLIRAAKAQDAAVVGLSKDTSLSFGGAFPFTLELEEWAEVRRAPRRCAVDVTEALSPNAPYRTYAVRWDPPSRLYRVDVLAGGGWNELDLLGALRELCNDVAFPGYPYPLARVHQRFRFPEHEVLDLRRRLESVVAERRGTLYSLRLFGRGRDVLALGD